MVTSRIGRPRVLIIIQNLHVPFDRRVWLECQSLVAAGYDVTVICPRGAKREAIVERAIRSRANLSPSAGCVRHAAGSRVLTARRVPIHASDDTFGDS